MEETRIEDGIKGKEADNKPEDISIHFYDPEMLRYYDILKANMPQGLGGKGSLRYDDKNPSIAYLIIETPLKIGYSERKELPRIFNKSREKNIIAELIPEQRLIETSEQLTDLLSKKGRVVMGAAGPDVSNHGYKLFFYVIGLEHYLK